MIKCRHVICSLPREKRYYSTTRKPWHLATCSDFFIKKTVRGNQICPSLSKLSPSMLLLTQQLKISRTKAAAMLHYMHGEQPQHLQDLPVIIWIFTNDDGNRDTQKMSWRSVTAFVGWTRTQHLLEQLSFSMCNDCVIVLAMSHAGHHRSTGFN